MREKLLLIVKNGLRDFYFETAGQDEFFADIADDMDYIGEQIVDSIMDKIEVNDDALWNILREHRGHTVEIGTYGDWDDPHDICLEDIDTNEIILDAEMYTVIPRREAM